MAEEEREEEKPKKKGLLKLPIKLLSIIAAVVAGLVLVIIVATWAAKPRPPEFPWDPEAQVEEKKVPPVLTTWLAGTPEGFLAKLADEEETHLVKTGEFRLAYDPKYKELAKELDERQFQIIDIINTVLITKTSKDLSSEEGKNELKREIINRINPLLSKGRIEDIYVQIIVQ